MKFFITTFFLFITLSNFVTGQTMYQNYYTEGAVRYDFELTGKHQMEELVHEQTKFLSKWGGNPNHIIEEFNFGSYQFQLFDISTNSMILQQGFSPLFWEWQTTAEAKLKKKSFYHSVFFPKPKEDVKIVFNTRDKFNNWQPIFTDTIYLSSYFILTEKSKYVEVDTIAYHGKSSEKVDLVVLSEGYTAAEMDKFSADVRRLTHHLLSVAPFNLHVEKFNVFAVKVPSEESGTDIPGENIYKNTAFNSHFYTFDSPRYLTTSDMKSIYDAIDGLAWDQIYLLVNTNRYGGGGFFNFLNVCTSDNVRSEFVFCHEFGHGFAGLGDEYYTSDTSYEEYIDKSVEPWEPNLTTLVDFDKKWKKQLNSNTPIPTPRDSVNTSILGVFEGGGYESKGVYSPVMSCWMKVHTADGFCPVCSKTIEKVILYQTE